VCAGEGWPVGVGRGGMPGAPAACRSLGLEYFISFPPFFSGEGE
jgi:hypothetical protein